MVGNTNKMEEIKKIKNGKGIQYILDEAYKIMGNPILMHDMDYKAMGYTENKIKDDCIWNEITTCGVGHDRLVFYREECFFEMAANAKKVTFLFSDKLKYDRIFGKLFTKNNVQVGCACLLACYKSLEKEDPELFEMVCDILNRELCDSEFYQNYGQKYMEILIGKIIEDKIKDKELYIAHIESIYNGLRRNLHLIVVDITQSTSIHTKLEYFRDFLKGKMPDFKYIIYSNYILIIASSDDIILHIEENLSKIYDFFEQNNIYVGISSCFQNLLELKKYYKQALNALNYGINVSGKHNILEYDNFRLYCFLNSVKKDANIWDLCHPIVFSIQEYDKKNGTSYINILSAYLELGGNSSLASESIKMTYDEFCIQLHEVIENFKIDFNNGNMRLSIFISVKMLEYFSY